MIYKFIAKTFLFAGPFVIMHVVNLLCYGLHEGDLVRSGYLYSNPSPKSEILKTYGAVEGVYDRVSSLQLKKPVNYTAMTIGDSFSQQSPSGYKDYLSLTPGLSLLHFDRFLVDEKPIQTLSALVNGDFFDYVKVDYVVLQSVERWSVIRAGILNHNRKMDMADVREKIEANALPAAELKIGFFSDALIKIPAINIMYFFMDRPPGSKTYKVAAEDGLFSSAPGELLFFYQSLEFANINNDKNNVAALNKVLNKIHAKLLEKGVRLIVLISPDKYGLYYPYIKNRQAYERPLFFDHFSPMAKDYFYVDAKNILASRLPGQQDLYFYDDTHWSPLGAELISENIIEKINQSRPLRDI